MPKQPKANPSSETKTWGNKHGFWTDMSTLTCLSNLGIKGSTSQLYFLVKHLANKSGVCNASDDYLAKTLGVGTATVSRSLAQLVKEKAIERKTAPGPHGKKRRVLLPLFDNRSKMQDESIKMMEPSYNTSSKYEEEVYGGVENAAVIITNQKKGTGATSRDDFSEDESRVVALLQSWPAQVHAQIKSTSKRSVPPADPSKPLRKHLRAVIEAAKQAYPDADIALAARHLVRACASTTRNRDLMCEQAYHPQYGDQLIGLRLCVHTGPKNKMLQAASLLYTRSPPEPLSAEALAAPSQEEFNAAMHSLNKDKWTDPCWSECIREAAARIKLYNVAINDYLKCADALSSKFLEIPYLWIFDSITREELANAVPVSAKRRC